MFIIFAKKGLIKLIIANNMSLNLENVSFLYAFQNFTLSFALPLLSPCHLTRYTDLKINK